MTFNQESLIKFFILSLGEPELVRSAFFDASKLSKKKKTDEISLDEDRFVKITNQIFHKYSKLRSHEFKYEKTFSYWQSDSYLQGWKLFKEKTQDDQMLIVLWTHVFKVSKENLFSSLSATEGAINLRLANGLKKMARLIHRETTI